MKDFIGYPLEVVAEELKEENVSFEVVENSFKVEGDKLLITNVENQDDKVVLTVGKFIFDIEGKKDEKNIKN